MDLPGHTPHRDASGSDGRHRFGAHEELVNTLTHAAGVAMSAAAAVLLVVRSTAVGDPWRIVSYAVFAATALVLYGASTVYHAVSRPALKRRLEMLDHQAIFLLIAGTYTPFTLVPLRGVVGWVVFGIVWSMAVVGILLKVFTIGRFRRLSVLIYLIMGWTVVGAIVPLVRAVDTATLVWLAVGGIAYSLGTVFYLNRRIPYSHGIWHLFVLAGTSAHVLSVYSL